MSSTDALHLFVLNACRTLGEQVGANLGVAPSPHEERIFEDGEHKTRPLVNVRGADVYVLQALHRSPDESINDRLIRLLFFLGALRDAGAARLTVVAPYLCYARKDRKTKAHDPVTTRYLAALFESVGVDQIVALDVHNPAAFQNAFRCPTVHLEARPLLARYVASTGVSSAVTVISPDAGGMKRARAFSETLAHLLGCEVGLGFMEKQRSGGQVSDHGFLGDVDGRTALIVDDLIASGTTLMRAAEACRARGATQTWAIATHGVFAETARTTLSDPALDAIVITDTIPPYRIASSPVEQKLTVCSIASFLAEAIHRLHTHGSLPDLLSP